MPMKKSTPSVDPSTIHEAVLVPGGVGRGRQIDEAEAVLIRLAQGNVVVCGPSVRENRTLARRIEVAAYGDAERDDAHKNLAGPNALPHFHPRPRIRSGQTIDGHCFYETDNLKAE